MAETYTTSAPVGAVAGVSVFRVSLLVLDLFERRVKVHVREWDGTNYSGQVISLGYEGQEAYDLIVALNKVNLSTTSLQRRVINRLVTDGKLPPGVAGGVVD